MNAKQSFLKASIARTEKEKRKKIFFAISMALFLCLYLLGLARSKLIRCGAYAMDDGSHQLDYYRKLDFLFPLFFLRRLN